MGDGMDEIDGMGAEADAAIGVAALGTILEVAADGQADMGELTANLMVSPRVEIYFEEGVVVVGSDGTEVEQSLLGVGLLAVVGIRLVLLLVSQEVVLQMGGLADGRRRYDGPIGLTYLIGAEHLVESCQGLAGASKDDDAAHRAVEPMNDTKEDGARLGVGFLDVLFHHVAQGGIACLVALNDFSRLLVDNDDMVVFVENFHLFGLN